MNPRSMNYFGEDFESQWIARNVGIFCAWIMGTKMWVEPGFNEILLTGLFSARRGMTLDRWSASQRELGTTRMMARERTTSPLYVDTKFWSEFIEWQRKNITPALVKFSSLLGRKEPRYLLPRLCYAILSLTPMEPAISRVSISPQGVLVKEEGCMFDHPRHAWMFHGDLLLDLGFKA